MIKLARLQFRFWLDTRKENERVLAEEIESLKSQRTFAKTIRDGIRLIVDLRNGNTDVLFELFPLLKAKLQNEFSGNSANGLTEEKIRAIIWEATNDPTSGINMKPLPSVPTPKPLVLPDNMPVIEVKKSDKQDAGQDFLKSIMALQQ